MKESDMSIYLCHKCEGVLQGDAPKGASRCTCISGYVRDFYKPVAFDDVLPRQLAQAQDRLELYRSQGREPTDPLVIAGQETIKRLKRP
jgi:hypothetical protein